MEKFSLSLSETKNDWFFIHPKDFKEKGSNLFISQKTKKQLCEEFKKFKNAKYFYRTFVVESKSIVLQFQFLKQPSESEFVYVSVIQNQKKIGNFDAMSFLEQLDEQKTYSYAN